MTRPSVGCCLLGQVTPSMSCINTEACPGPLLSLKHTHPSSQPLSRTSTVPCISLISLVFNGDKIYMIKKKYLFKVHNSASLITSFVSNSFFFFFLVIHHIDARAWGHGPSNSTHPSSHAIYATALKDVTPHGPTVSNHHGCDRPQGQSHPASGTDPRRVDFLSPSHPHT